MKEIVILNCHYNDFIAHPNWWAVMIDPKIKKDEVFSFNMDNELKQVICIKVITPGEDREDFEAKNLYANRFRGWFIILYNYKGVGR